MSEISFKTISDLLSSNRAVMESAFNCIYQKYSSLVYYVAFDILHSRDDAEDITNETFLKFYESRTSLKNPNKIKYLLTTISKNLSINKIKVREVACDYVEEVVESEEKNNQFDSFIEQFKSFLVKDELDIVVYHLLYGFSFKDIATWKDVTTSVISSKYRRIIEKIKAHYKE